MIWNIALKEIRLNLLTFRFAVAMALCAVLSGVITFVQLDQYERTVHGYREALKVNEDHLSDVKVYKLLRPKAIREPSPLSVFARGIEGRLGNETTAVYDEVPYEAGLYVADNPLLAYFPEVDVALVVKVVLSLLAMVFAYDAISGEKEHGTLALVLSHGVGRHQILLGKYLGGMLSLMMPAVVSFLIFLLILTLSSGIALSGGQVLRIGILVALSGLFLSAFFLFGLLFSTFTERSALALLFGLFCWIILAVLIPNGGAYVATRIRPVPRLGDVERDAEGVYERYEEKIDEYYDAHPWPKGQSQSQWDGIVQAGTRVLMDWYKDRHSFSKPIRVQRADEIGQVVGEYFRRLGRQRDLAEALTGLSPIVLYSRTIEAFAGTALEEYLRFMAAARQYRRQILTYLEEKDAFRSYAWFTALRDEEIPENREELQELWKEWRESKKPFREITADLPARDLSDLPRFSLARPSLGRAFSSAAIPLAALAAINVLLFMATFVSFMKYDPR